MIALPFPRPVDEILSCILHGSNYLHVPIVYIKNSIKSKYFKTRYRKEILSKAF